MATRSRASEVLPPSKLRERKRKKRIFIIFILVLLGFSIIGGTVYALHLDALRIRDVAIDGAETISPAALQASAREVLAGTRWHIIPNNSVLVYSNKKLSTHILETFPKVKTARVSLDNFHGVRITISERSPVALWCGAEWETAGSESRSCFFLDDGGYVYGEAAQFSGPAYVRWYGNLNKNSPPAQFLSADSFSTLRALIEALKNDTNTPLRVVVDPNGDVNVFFKENFELRFTLAQKPEDILARLRTAEVSEVLAGKKLSDLEYLDLRFGNRLYYKFK